MGVMFNNFVQLTDIIENYTVFSFVYLLLFFFFFKKSPFRSYKKV